MRHAPVRRQLAWALVFLTWFAQLCLPVAHAAMATSTGGAMPAWCGSPANASEAMASLPAEIRDALDPDATSAEHLASCAKLCAAIAKLPPLPSVDAVHSLPVSNAAPVPAAFPTHVARRHALPPPSHGPPAWA